MHSFTWSAPSKSSEASVGVGTDFGSIIFADAFFFVTMLCRNVLPLQKVGDNCFLPEQSRKLFTNVHVTRCLFSYGSELPQSLSDLFRTGFWQKRERLDRKYESKVTLLALFRLCLQDFYFFPRRIFFPSTTKLKNSSCSEKITQTLQRTAREQSSTKQMSGERLKFLQPSEDAHEAIASARE